MMVILNDPVPESDPAERGVRMVLAMRAARRTDDDVAQPRSRPRLRSRDRLRLRDLGGVGFEHRLDYAAIGTVPNLASRLSDQAKAGQILLSQRTLSTVGDRAVTRPVGELQLKGFHRSVPAYELLAWRRPEALAFDERATE